MSQEPVEARKRVLRAAARALPTQGLEGASAEAQRRLLELPELDSVGVVFLYAAAAHEVSTDALAARLRARGMRLIFARVRGSELRLLEAKGPEDLAPGYQGILEPTSNGAEALPEEVDLFVLPGLLFDRSGHRLGRGGGHLDRLLEGAREDARRVGLCYAQRVVQELPAAPWDVAMHVVVTDREVIRPERPGEKA